MLKKHGIPIESPEGFQSITSFHTQTRNSLVSIKLVVNEVFGKWRQFQFSCERKKRSASITEYPS